MQTNTIYTARVQGHRIESLSLQGALKGTCRQLGIPEANAFTVQKEPGRWLVVADPRDALGCAMIEIAPVEL